jgi:hypothetical protein
MKAFHDCSSLTEITLPPALTSISEDAFAKCSSLTSVNIPVAVKEIGGSAFEECVMLSTIELPSSLKRIGGSAFAKCSSLRTVILNSPAPPTISKSTFKGTAPTFLVPRGSVSVYMSHKDWKNVSGFKEK